MFVVLTLALAVIYRYGPSREAPRWRWITWGSAMAAILWLGISALFSRYASSFGKFNETYGSLGAVIGFMTWLWISAIVILLGAELDAEMEHQTARDTTTGSPKPMGARGPGWPTRSERPRAGDAGPTVSKSGLTDHEAGRTPVRAANGRRSISLDCGRDRICREFEVARTVLVVDDDPLVLEVTADMLKDLGCEVVTAASGMDAARAPFGKREHRNSGDRSQHARHERLRTCPEDGRHPARTASDHALRAGDRRPRVARRPEAIPGAGSR